MNKLNIFINIILLGIMYYINYEYLKISTFVFTGIVLGALLFLNIVSSIFANIVNKKKGLKSSTSFIFSEDLSKKMQNMDQGIQYESTVISLAFIIIGSLAMVIYIIFFMEISLILKVFIAFNSICGVVLMASMLVTNYQQLVSYRLAMESYAVASQTPLDLDKMKGGSL